MRLSPSRTLVLSLGWAIGSFSVVPLAAGASVASSLTTLEKRELQREARLVIDLLQNYHYAARTFSEVDGAEMVVRFLDTLDPHGYVLTRTDGEFLLRRFGRTLKTVYLLKGDVQPAFEIFDYFAARSEERFAWIEQRLRNEFDFTTDERLEPAALDQPPADRAAADRRWELRLKDEIIDAIVPRPMIAISATLAKMISGRLLKRSER